MRDLEYDTGKIWLVNDRTRATLRAIIDDNLHIGTPENPVYVVTDGFAAYRYLDNFENIGVVFGVVIHDNAWGYGIFTTNPIEQFWALIKRKIKSVYKRISWETLQ